MSAPEKPGQDHIHPNVIALVVSLSSAHISAVEVVSLSHPPPLPECGITRHERRQLVLFRAPQRFHPRVHAVEQMLFARQLFEVVFRHSILNERSLDEGHEREPPPAAHQLIVMRQKKLERLGVEVTPFLDQPIRISARIIIEIVIGDSSPLGVVVVNACECHCKILAEVLA